MGVPAAAVRAGGVFALGHVDHAELMPSRRRRTDRAQARPGAAPTARGSSGQRRRPGHGHALALASGPLGSRVLGPAWYGYVTVQTLDLPSGQAVRPLRESDLPLLAFVRLCSCDVIARRTFRSLKRQATPGAYDVMGLE